jgi:multiple sugar transport system substrate-binding protein
LYAIPKDFDTIGLFYNKELFDKAGVKYPDDTWTWDNLLDAAKKLTVRDGSGNISQYGFVATSGGQTCTYDFILANGGKILTEDRMKSAINTPESAEALQYLYDMMYVHKVSPTGAEQKETDHEKLFQSGKIAMIPNGSWVVPPYFQALGDKVNVAPLPQKKERGNVIHGLGFAVSAKSKNPEAAWQFAKFCATKEAQEYEAGVVIPAFSGAEKVWLDAYPSMDLKIFIEALDYAVPIPQTAKGASGASTVFENEMQNIWLQAKDVATGLADCDKGINDEIAKGK